VTGTGPPPADRPPGGGDGRPGLDEGDARRLATIGAIVLGLALLLIFIVQNSRQVTVSFVFFEARMSLIWVIVLSAVAGWLIGILVAFLLRRRRVRPEG
jgi:uncharacterized integral membrane protein